MPDASVLGTPLISRQEAWQFRPSPPWPLPTPDKLSAVIHGCGQEGTQLLCAYVSGLWPPHGAGPGHLSERAAPSTHLDFAGPASST
jgi:hypothetical protein